MALLDANPGAGHVDVAQSGHVAFLHTPDIELDGDRAGRSDDTLGQRVASPHQLFGRHRLQAQTSLFQAPHLVIGIMVPLPDAPQLLIVEVLRALIGSEGLCLLLWHSN